MVLKTMLKKSGDGSCRNQQTLTITDMASSVSSASTSAPRLHVTAHLPPVISFSSIEEPQLEMHMTLRYSQPIIVALKQSRLWPLHLRSALTLNHANSGRYEYISGVDAPTNGPLIVRLTKNTSNTFWACDQERRAS